MTETYQTYLPVDDTNPAEDEFTEKNIEFMNKLEKLGVKRLTIGFATEADESRLRHVEADIVIDGQLNECMDHQCSAWPEELDFNRGYDPWEYLDNYDLECMLTIHPGPKRINSGSGLYITEPELRDDMGGEISWNYYD
jgi:hypothetical protein